jgi:hypothetical protein
MALNGTQRTGLCPGGPGRAYAAFTPKALSVVVVAFTSAGVVYIPIRMVSGLWSVSGVAASKGELAWLPPARQPIGFTDSRGNFNCDPAWYRFFEYVAETRLGGRQGPAIPAVAAVVAQTQVTAAASTTAVTELQQQTQANAEALFVVREVAVNNSLTGAGLIPQVEL